MFYLVLLFTQNFIPFYSSNSCDSNAHGFILKGSVFIQFTMLENKTIKIACFGNLGFKKMGILKKNKLLFRGGVSHKQRETRGFCQKQGF